MAKRYRFPVIEEAENRGLTEFPDEDWGEQVKAVIEPAPGVEPSPRLAEEILAFCLQHAAEYKCSKSIDFIDVISRDPNGKLYKRKLRDPYWKGHERTI
jgi:long-chain acyl-CoA synthetase